MNIMTEYDDMSVFKKPYGYRYRLEVTHTNGQYWVNIDILQEALNRMKRLDKKTKNLIELKLYRMIESMELVYSKNYSSGRINDKTWKCD